MFVDRKRRRWPRVVVATVALFIVVCFINWVVPRSDESMGEESALALKAAVERCALQCYVVEGIYPPSLSYLEENYGLQINKSTFYVSYDVFASNLPPDVRVTSRH